MRNKSILALKSSVSVYDIVLWSNLIITLIDILQYNSTTLYISNHTVLLCIILGIIIHLILCDAKKHHNPFLFITGFVLVFFYQFRIYTLAATEYSGALESSGCTASDITWTYVYIIICTIIVWFSFHSIKSKLRCSMFLQNRGFLNILRLLLITLTLSTLSELPIFDVISRILNTFFFSFVVILLFSFLYYLQHLPSISKKQKLIFWSVVLFFIITQTLAGNRSAFYNLFFILLPSLLIERQVLIRIKYLLVMLFLLPVLVTLFTYATFLRKNSSVDEGVSTKLNMVSSVLKTTEFDNILLLLSPVYERVGYLDYTSATIKNEKHFYEFINPIYCAKSIVDNVLSPGFDIYDVPKMSNCAKIYYDGGQYSKQYLKNADYGSTLFTIFGEFYVMFGKWLGLFAVFFICYLLKKLYLKFQEEGNKYKMAATVYLFVLIFNSFGIDWFLLNVVTIIINYYIFRAVCPIYRSAKNNVILKQK